VTILLHSMTTQAVFFFIIKGLLSLLQMALIVREKFTAQNVFQIVLAVTTTALFFFPVATLKHHR